MPRRIVVGGAGDQARGRACLPIREICASSSFPALGRASIVDQGVTLIPARLMIAEYCVISDWIIEPKPPPSMSIGA